MYKYKFRPFYGSKDLLIEFSTCSDSPNFFSDFLKAISELNPKIFDFKDLWMNDEFLINIETKIGEFTFSKDIWNIAFIMSEKNQNCVIKINSILEKTENFIKEEIDFKDYELK